MPSDRIGLLDRASLILSELASASPQPRRLGELSAATGLHRATAHRLLAQMQRLGYVGLTKRGYVLGPLCWSLGRAAAKRYDFGQIASDSVRRIADATGDVGLLSTRLGAYAELILRVEGSWPVHPTAMRAGTVRPLGCTAHALALLAALPDREIAGVLDATRADRAVDYPLFTDAHLLELVEQTRAAGFAYTSGQIIPGTGAFALACLDADGAPVAALSHSAVIERCGLDRAPEIVPLLRRERDRIERRIRGLADPASEERAQD